MSKGYNIFSISSIPDINEVIETLYNIYVEKINRSDYKEKLKKKKYLVNLLEEVDYKKHPKINNFILNDLFTKSAAKYFKNIPIIASAQLWLSINNNTKEGSQKWHKDNEDKKQIKFFIPIRDIEIDMGPTCFIDKIKSKAILKSIEHETLTGQIGTSLKKSDLGKKRVGDLTGRIPDQLINENEIIKGTIKKHDGLALDTASCLHMGSRTTGISKHRIVLMIQFLPPNSHGESSYGYPPIQLNNEIDSELNKLIIDK